MATPAKKTCGSCLWAQICPTLRSTHAGRSSNLLLAIIWGTLRLHFGVVRSIVAWGLVFVYWTQSVINFISVEEMGRTDVTVYSLHEAGLGWGEMITLGMCCVHAPLQELGAMPIRSTRKSIPRCESKRVCAYLCNPLLSICTRVCLSMHACASAWSHAWLTWARSRHFETASHCAESSWA